MNVLKDAEESGFSIVQAMIGFSLLTAASLMTVSFFQQQEKNIKKQSGDISINHLMQNISTVMSARSICTHSVELMDPFKIIPQDGKFNLNKIAMPMANGQADFVFAQVETEATAFQQGKFGAWINEMYLTDLSAGATEPIRKAKLVMEFKRRIDHNVVKTNKHFIDINLLVSADGQKLESCFGTEDSNSRAFCETSLMGKYDQVTGRCTNIQLSSSQQPGSEFNYAMKTFKVTDPSTNELIDSNIHIDGSAAISKWYEIPGQEETAKYITIDQGNITNVRQIFAYGDIQSTSITANRYNHRSDRRLKKNIKPLTPQQADQVLKLNGVSFDWKDTDQAALGFIAQDVEKVYPNLVKTNERTNTLAVDYAGIIPLLLEKMKAQELKINELEAKLSKLKAGQKP